MKICDFKAFTLAEVMIVLTVIGVLTAILLPVARQSMPDENLMKCKKAHNTLGTVIRELVTSDKYYLDGDLGVRINSNQIDGSNNGDTTYFCNTFAEVINTKSVNCSEFVPDAIYNWYRFVKDKADNPPQELSVLDEACKGIANDVGAEIVSSDNVIYYQIAPAITFGWRYNVDGVDKGRIFNIGGMQSAQYINNDGIPYYSKGFCIDIDGIGEGEEPFGYGIRADGKIFVGLKAQEWLERETLEE